MSSDKRSFKYQCGVQGTTYLDVDSISKAPLFMVKKLQFARQVLLGNYKATLEEPAGEQETSRH